MDVGKCTLQGRVSSSNRIKKGRRVVIHAPKKGGLTVDQVEYYLSSLGLGGIKMVPPGCITPWRMACKIAHFKGNVKAALDTLPVEFRKFYEDKVRLLQPDLHQPGSKRSPHQRFMR